MILYKFEELMQLLIPIFLNLFLFFFFSLDSFKSFPISEVRLKKFIFTWYKFSLFSSNLNDKFSSNIFLRKSKRKNDLLNNPTNSNPGPGQYNADKTIKFIKVKIPSWKIGSSKRRSLSQSDKNVPGVGNYTISGTFGKNSPHYSMRIKGILSNYSNDVPGPGTYNNDKMNLYKHYPSWKIGTSQRDEDLRRKIKESFPGPGRYGFKSLKDYF